jgi:hypothetical protein
VIAGHALAWILENEIILRRPADSDSLPGQLAFIELRVAAKNQ